MLERGLSDEAVLAWAIRIPNCPTRYVSRQVTPRPTGRVMRRPDPSIVVRLGTESLVVLLSILAAFQLEEWRDDRAAFRVETAQLAAIRDDLLENQVRLDTVMTLQREVVESTRILTLLHLDATPRPSPDSIAGLIGRAGAWWRLEPVTAAYDAMVSSGDVTRLQSRSLLRELAAFSSDLRVEFEDQAESMALMAEMHRLQMEYGLGLLPSTAWQYLVGMDGSPSESAIASLVKDPRHAFLVLRRGRMEANRLELYQRLDGAIARLLRLLDNELAERGASS